MKRSIGLAAFAAYVATVFVANYLVSHVGLVSVGFGLMAPAAVYAAGFAFTFRDVVQKTLGRRLVVVAILLGALASLVVSTHFALASGAAFLVSEALDFAVYTPLEDRNWPLAVALSNVAGLVADSVLFLWLAFGSLSLLPGQIVGKTWTTLAALVVIGGLRAVLPRHARDELA